jgi:hypothetical protein
MEGAILTDNAIFEMALKEANYPAGQKQHFSSIFFREGLAAKRALTARLFENRGNVRALRGIVEELARATSVNVVLKGVECGGHRVFKGEWELPIECAVPFETREGGTATVTKVVVDGHEGKLFALKTIKSHTASSLWVKELEILRAVKFVHLTRLLATFVEPAGFHIILYPWCIVRKVYRSAADGTDRPSGISQFRKPGETRGRGPEGQFPPARNGLPCACNCISPQTQHHPPRH